MTPEGYKIVCDVLATVPEIEGFTVYPEPEEGQDIDKVQVIIPNVDSNFVHNALTAAGLTRRSTKPHTSPGAPNLEFYSVVIPWKTKDAKTIGFRDRSAE